MRSMITLLLIFALLAAACGDDAAGIPAASAPTTSATTTTTAPAESETSVVDGGDGAVEGFDPSLFDTEIGDGYFDP